MKVLAINPGGTSTKIAVYEGETCVFQKTVRHDAKDLAEFDGLMSQYPFRAKVIDETLAQEGVDLSTLDAVVGRGGVLAPMEGGVYQVEDNMIHYVQHKAKIDHACNLGCVIAKEIADQYAIPSYVVDPVSVDEFAPEARITGLNDIEKPSLIHALNHKAVAKAYCTAQGIDYRAHNFIIAHLGSGVSVVPHRKGRMVDCTGGVIDGAFSNCRTGSVPTKPLIQLCFSGKYTEKELLNKVTYAGGMSCYLGTDDVKCMMEQYTSDPQTKLVMDAFVYQVTKEIASFVPALDNDVTAVILTGGMAYSQTLTDMIGQKINYIAPVVLSPGEEELWALASGAIRGLTGQEEVKHYTY